MQIAEMAVHAWDLTVALGLTLELDPELAKYSADWMYSVLVPEYRGSEADRKALGRSSRFRTTRRHTTAWL